jgi:hypothetical protein
MGFSPVGKRATDKGAPGLAQLLLPLSISLTGTMPKVWSFLQWVAMSAFGGKAHTNRSASISTYNPKRISVGAKSIAIFFRFEPAS